MLTHPSQIYKSLLVTLILTLSASVILAQTTAFTYQGKLVESGNLANGNYDFQFKLFDTATIGTGIQQGSTVSLTNVAVTAGIFTVNLDFGACANCFNGANRFLEISVKQTSGGIFTTLGPRQSITSTPYALKSVNATTAANATTADGLSMVCVSCITSSHIQSVNGSAVTGTIPLTSVPAGSANYIQNTTSQQVTSNFNVSGTGTAPIFNATTQYNINGLRMFSVNGPFNNGVTSLNATNTFIGEFAGMNLMPGSVLTDFTGKFNSFFGVGSGKTNNTGISNSFFGAFAGGANISGGFNSFFGNFAGAANTTASDNSFFGNNAGVSNTTGAQNSFFGSSAGDSNTLGNLNSFFGYNSGLFTSTGSDNSFFGSESGKNNTMGGFNSFFGVFAGSSNTTGNNNVFIGNSAGFANSTGSNNTMIGPLANVSANNLTNATAIGYRTLVSASNSLVLGGINGVNFATADTNIGIGVTAPQSRLHVNNGISWFQGDNSPLPSAAGAGVGIGYNATNDFGFLFAFDYNLFTPRDLAINNAGGNVGIGTASPQDKLHVNGILRLATLGAAGSTQLCRNASNQISTCSSSLRYKTDLQPFIGGLAVVQRLQPIIFRWKTDGTPDVGLGAEEVAQVEPLLTFTNARGEIEGVKYNQLSVVLINAIKEQQQQIENYQAQLTAQQKQLAEYEKWAALQQQQINRQQAQLNAQQREMDAIKRLLCLQHPNTEVCHP